MHKLDGVSWCTSGLYIHDLARSDNYDSTTSPSYSYLQTVAQNKARYTRQQVEYADRVQALHHKLGRPSIRKFTSIISKNLLLNCPYSTDDVKRAKDIYGADVGFLKGKTTDSPDSSRERDRPHKALPEHIRDNHLEVVLCCDVFYLQGLAFSISFSKHIRFVSVRFLADNMSGSLAAALRADMKLYTDQGLIPTTLHGDREYNSIRGKLPGVNVVGLCRRDSHVPEAERTIRTLKETTRATVHRMPYQKLPKTLVKGLANYAMQCHNLYPDDDGVSPDMSPETILRGTPRPDFKSISLEFGAYVQIYDGTSNNVRSRTLGAMAMYPTFNVSGDYYFMSLATGARVQRHSWTVVPVNDLVVSRVEALGSQDNMPPVQKSHQIAEHDVNLIVDEDEYDVEHKQPVTQESGANNAKEPGANDLNNKGATVRQETKFPVMTLRSQIPRVVSSIKWLS